MELLYIYIIFFIFFILITRDKLRKIVFLSVLFLYLASSISALYIYNIMYSNSEIVFEAVIFHIIMLFLLLYPLQYFDNIKYKKIPKSDDKRLELFAKIIVFLCIFKMYFDFKNIDISILLTDVNSLRNSLTEGEFRQSNVIIRYLTFFANHYWSIALVLSFYYMIHYPQRHLLILLLLLSSLGVIVSGITVAAREYLVKYVFLLLILTYWFSSSISTYWKRFIRTGFIVLSISFISFFLLITLLRFGEETSYVYTPYESLMSYLGQGYINFSSTFTEFAEGVTGGALKFPVFVSKSISAYNLGDTIYSKTELNTFTTTIGSWVFDVGIYITVFLVLLHHFIFRRIAKKEFNIFNLIYIIWIYDFIFSCLFFYNETINGGRILSILFVVFFEHYSYRKSKKVYTYYQ